MVKKLVNSLVCFVASLLTAYSAPDILLNSGATLMLDHNRPSLTNSDVFMNGGEIDVTGNGYQRFGTMTLMKDSQITFENIASFSIYFKTSKNLDWHGTLTINGWDAALNNHIYFANQTSLNATQLSQISFNGFGSGAILLTSGELVPMTVPEINTVFTCIVLFLLVIWKELKVS